MEAKKFLDDLLGERFSFGSAIKAYRIREDLTQQELGDQLGVSKSHIKDLEKGNVLVSLEKAAKYAKKMGEIEKYFVKLAIQDQVAKAGLDYKVDVA